MFSVSDLKVSITSIQFSLFLDSKANVCPKCGHILDGSPLAEVTLSSVVLLLGVGSLVLYKWMSEKSKKQRSLPFGFAKASDEKMTTEEMVNDHQKELMRYKMLSSTPFITSTASLDLAQSIASSEASDLLFNLSELTDENEISIQKTSLHSIGNKTVAKLDLLLEQIRDIKQSVCDIDEQIFDVKESNVKFEPNLFSLGPDMSPITSNDNVFLNHINTEPQTPTLEWDSNDLNGVNAMASDSIASIDNRLISSVVPTPKRLINLSFSNHNILESSQDLTSPSISTSGEFSLNSNSEESSDGTQTNDEAMRRIISDAKKLGIFKELVDILVIKSKRDSAYFEE